LPKSRLQAKLFYKKMEMNRSCVDNNMICATSMTWQPNFSERKRKVGRSDTTWRRAVETERDKLGMNIWARAKTVAKDRNKWK